MARKQEEADLLTKAGVIVSLSYLVALFIFIPALRQNDLLGHENMEINELGDFLAGIFSPLAFLWLVLGFFQQKKELSLQIKEMQETNLHFNKTHKALEKAEKLRIAKIQPFFRVFFREVDEREHFRQLVIINSGHTVFDASIYKHDPVCSEFDPSPFSYYTHEFRNGELKTEHYIASPSAIYNNQINIDYRDEDGKQHREVFAFPTEDAAKTGVPSYVAQQINKDGDEDTFTLQHLLIGYYWE